MMSFILFFCYQLCINNGKITIMIRDINNLLLGLIPISPVWWAI